MRTFQALLLLIAAPIILQAQARPKHGERMPIFQGELNQWLAATLHYPDSARLKSIEGRCCVRFVVMEDGAVDSVQMLESSGNGYLDAEAIRVVRAMPRWKPGVQDGKYVKVFYTLPFNFKLDPLEEKSKPE